MKYQKNCITRQSYILHFLLDQLYTSTQVEKTNSGTYTSIKYVNKEKEEYTRRMQGSQHCLSILILLYLPRTNSSPSYPWL